MIERMQAEGYKSYFSGFTTKSVESLDLDICKQQIEDEVERKVQTLRGHRKYNSVTLPLSVRYSVTPVPNRRQPQLAFVQPAMARPRSPKKHHQSQEFDHEQMENMLDQTLLAIRQKLNILSSERNQMEQQMETLASGIKEACVQCRRVSCGSTNSTNLRRVRSIGESVASGVSPLTPKRTSISKDENDGVASDDALSVRTRSSTSASRESLDSSPIMNQKRSHSDSVNSNYSLASLSQSSRSTNSSSINRLSTANLDVFIDDWFSAVTIPELPESPRLSTPPYSRSPNFNRQRSTPDFDRRIQCNPSPRLQRNKRSSLPDSILNQIIKGDESFYNSNDSLSQMSVCTDPGSPKSVSNMIVRRSSLTGQMEHIRRPRTIVKRNSSFNTPGKGLASDLGPLSCSFGSIPEAAAFVTLRRPRPSHHRPLVYKRQRSVLLPSIETTV